MAEPHVYSIPLHRSFVDALATGLLRRFGSTPLSLARGRVLLPNNRAVRALTDAFVRASGSGLVLPRLIAIGDPDVDDRVGGAFDPIDLDRLVPPAIDPLERWLALSRLVEGDGTGLPEALRLAGDLGRALDALEIEEIPADRLLDALELEGDLALHWQQASRQLRIVVDRWPRILDERGEVDMTRRRNLLLRALADRWAVRPPEGFTIAAGIVTSAPAVTSLLARVARMPEGMVVLPGVSAADAMPEPEWEALGPDEHGRSEETHPQFALKRLLDRIGVARSEVANWPASGLSASTAERGRAVVHAMASAAFSDKWSRLEAAERRLSGVRVAVLANPAEEAQAIAIALRRALDQPGKTAALVTPDRDLAHRVAALLKRWDIDVDDSAGQPLAQTPAGSFLLAVAAAAAERCAPVALLALLKHPLAGGEGDERLAWLESVRHLDLALRGPRPPAGLSGITAMVEGSGRPAAIAAWPAIRQRLAGWIDLLDGRSTLSAFAAGLREAVDFVAGQRAWQGPDGRAAAELVARLEASPEAATLTLAKGDATPVLRQMMDREAVRRPYGGHPRLYIWGLLEARLQQADLMILGGMNEGLWPAEASPDPWLAPRLRRELGLPGLETRIGLSAHDFMSALGAPEVLLTRAERDSKAPTVASRFWRRLQAMRGTLDRDEEVERLARTIDAPAGPPRPVTKPAPRPKQEDRPRRISVTDLDRLKADPYAFYAKAILKLFPLEPVDAEHSAAWRGTAVHKLLEDWLREDQCAPDRLADRVQQFMSGEAIHPMLRALWLPRLRESIAFVAREVEADRAAGRVPLHAEVSGVALVAGVELKGKADRIDRLADGRFAIVDYKTGKPPSHKAVAEGFALQLGLLSLIAEHGGFEGVGEVGAHEYWSLARGKDHSLGFRVDADRDWGAAEFRRHAAAVFAEAAARWLTGDAPFEAKLNPAYARGDYDQLMRLEEWYGRD